VVNAELVGSLLAELRDRIDRVRACCAPTSSALESDRDARELVAFNLLLAVQSCSDIASHIIADEGWKPALTIASSFERLAEHDVIPSDCADALRRAAAFRNVLAHAYGVVRWSRVYSAATDGLADLETYAAAVAKWVAAR
jgi:uncharacterized protein YutE (UPF0331/DUF86 family)